MSKVSFDVLVTGEVVTLETENVVLTSGSVGIYSAVFSIDNTWDGLTLEAVFIAAHGAWPINPTARGVVRRSVPLVDNAAEVDPAVLAVAERRLWVGLQGLDEDGEVIKNSTLALVGKIQTGAEPDGPGDGDIPQSRYLKLLDLILNGGANVEVDLSAYALKTEIPKKTSALTNDSGFITKTVSDLANYYKKSETYTRTEIGNLISAIPKFAIEVVTSLPTSGISETTVYLKRVSSDSGNLYEEWIYANGAWELLGNQEVDLTGYPKRTEVSQMIAVAFETSRGEYYTKNETDLAIEDAKTEIQGEIPTKTSDLTNDSGFITGYTETDPTVPNWAKQTTKPTYAASEVGADPAGTAEAKVSGHNTSTSAHNDIRLLISELTTRLNALANSDDTTLDQMAEVVAYIKSNRSLIESITSGKVNVSDIVNNLTTNASNKPLSAAQGVALKALIDAITIPTALKNPNALTFTGGVTGSYDGSAAKTVNIPTSLKNPNALTFTGAATGSYDGSSAKTVNIPTVPTALKNPNALIINGTAYDGSEAVSVNISGGGDIYDTRSVMPEPVTVTVPDSPEMTLTLVAGKEYTISYDGQEYSCMAYGYDWGIALGNDTYEGKGNHEPFWLMQVEDGGTVWILTCWDKTDGETVEFAICEGGLKKLDHKYLDYGPRETLLCSADVTFSGVSGGMNKTTVGLDYTDLEDGKTYNVYIGDAKYVMTCETRTDDGEYKALTEVYPTVNASVTVTKANAAGYNDVHITKPSELGGTYTVRICKEVIETIPEEYLPEGIGGGSGGGTSDAVQYIPQTLTEEQQMQARKNLGLGWKADEEVCIVDNQTWTSELNSTFGAYVIIRGGDLDDMHTTKPCKVTWDGTTREHTPVYLSVSGFSGHFFGNLGFLAMLGYSAENTGEPYLFCVIPGETLCMTMDTSSTEHTVSIVGTATVYHTNDQGYIEIPTIDLIELGMDTIPEHDSGISLISLSCDTSSIIEALKRNVIVKVRFRAVVDDKDTDIVSAALVSHFDNHVEDRRWCITPMLGHEHWFWFEVVNANVYGRRRVDSVY